MLLAWSLVAQGATLSFERAGGQWHTHRTGLAHAGLAHTGLALTHMAQAVAQAFWHGHAHPATADHVHPADDASVVRLSDPDPDSASQPRAKRLKLIDLDGAAGRRLATRALAAAAPWPLQATAALRSVFPRAAWRPPWG